MSRRRPLRALSIALFFAGTWFGRTDTALAQESARSTALAAAERAYQEIDFEKMYEEALRAVKAGGATRDETTRLNVLLGISAAALGKDDEAKRAFVVALGVDPALKLDRTLSPKIREPYLEAQGFWGAYPERLALQARPAADGEHLTVELADPGQLVKQIVLRVRALGSQIFDSRTAVASRSARFPLPQGARERGYEYFSSAVDEHQNVLVEFGNEGDPRVEHAPAREPAQAPLAAAAPQRSYLLPAVLGAAGLVAAGVGVGFHVARESAAREWNGPGCEQPGSSRIEQCGDVDDRIKFDQAMAIGSYTAAGLLLTGSVFVLLYGSSSSHERPPATARAGLVGCGLSGPVLSCAGRF
jgi:hypothetical protein